jgi:hypothetical protein
VRTLEVLFVRKGTSLVVIEGCAVRRLDGVAARLLAVDARQDQDAGVLALDGVDRRLEVAETVVHAGLVEAHVAGPQPAGELLDAGTAVPLTNEEPGALRPVLGTGPAAVGELDRSLFVGEGGGDDLDQQEQCDEEGPESFHRGLFVAQAACPCREGPGGRARGG